MNQTHTCPHPDCRVSFEFTASAAMPAPTLCPRCTRRLTKNAVANANNRPATRSARAWKRATSGAMLVQAAAHRAKRS